MEGDLDVMDIPIHIDISIHSLRMEGDISCFAFSNAGSKISIHSLRMEGDSSCLADSLASVYFNPLPPHGGRRSCNVPAGT